MENLIITELIEKLINSEINIYLIKFNAKSEKKTIALQLPDDINDSLVDDYIRYLYGFKDRETKTYNPNGNTTTTLPELGLSAVEKRWNIIYGAIIKAKDLSQREISNINNSSSLTYSSEELNLYVTEIKDTRDDSYSYFVSKYQNIQKVLKYKKLFFEESGHLTEKEPNKTLTLNWNVDVAILNERLYVLSERGFNSIFDYDENLKEAAMKTVNEHVQKWKIFDNLNDFIKLTTKKYAYRGIAKISKDSQYLKAIEEFSPEVLKTRIMQKCNNVFSEDDFKENLLHVTSKNNKKIIHMISKELKYNIFEDKVEEWKI